jgi:predicted TIM-barrel fold metal-dependent hydrolase
MRCDSHVHIAGPVESHPQASGRTYLAPPAPLDALRERAARRGIDSFVIVQPSFYGTDNTLLLQTLDELSERGRGVAAVDPAAIAPAELANYARRGVRGLRVNLYTPKNTSDHNPLACAFPAMAEHAQAMRWHVEIVCPMTVLMPAAAVLADSPVPVVIDHYGVYGREVPSSAAGRAMLDLMRRPHVWVKLSAPYRVSDDPLATRPNPEWLTAILAVAGSRCVWGSDWPHTPRHEDARGPTVPGIYRDISYEALLDDFIAALASAELAETILSSNPARLYGF